MNRFRKNEVSKDIRRRILATQLWVGASEDPNKKKEKEKQKNRRIEKKEKNKKKNQKHARFSACNGAAGDFRGGARVGWAQSLDEIKI